MTIEIRFRKLAEVLPLSSVMVALLGVSARAYP
jgi:hypothetical protein